MKRPAPLLFGLLLALQVVVYGWLLLDRRLPTGHDSFSVYLLQYLFQALALADAGPALWLPHLGHGIVSTWFANLQAGLLQNVLLLGGGVPEGTPMPLVFYAGLFVEDLVLLVGLWRLGGRFYRTPAARFLVAAAALGGSVVAINLFWNHRLLFAVPLTLSLLLDVVDTGSRGKLLLALSLGSLQVLGNAPYIPLLPSLAVLLCVLLYAFVHRKRLRPAFPRLKPRLPDLAWLAAALLLVLPVCLLAVEGLGSIRQYHGGRGPDGRVTLDAYLTHAGSFTPLRYLDLVLGLTPTLDYSLYCGLCVVALAVVGVVQRPGRPALHLATTLLLLLFFSMGYLGLAAPLAYYGIPLLQFFRYVGLAAPLVKLFLILLAGFGVDAFARPSSRGAGLYKGAAVGFGILCILAVRVYVLELLGRDPGDPLTLLTRFSVDNLQPRKIPSDSEAATLPVVLIFAATAAVLFLARARTSAPRRLLAALLILQTADVFVWRLRILRDETTPVRGAVADLQALAPIPYAPRRTQDYAAGARWSVPRRDRLESGAVYDYWDPFVHVDPTWSRYWVTQWSTPVDLLLRARAGRPLANDGIPPPKLDLTGSRAPGYLSEAFAKVIGAAEDKLQAFSTAHAAGSDEAVASLMKDPSFRGDVLLLSPSASLPSPGEWPADAAARRERLEASVRVLAFTGDRLRAEVAVPPSAPEPWLVYCDAWHAGWSATVNGAARPVERGNLAYKAVRLDPGANVVEFRFDAPLRRVCTPLVRTACLFWCLLAAAWTLAFLGVPVLGRRTGLLLDGDAPPAPKPRAGC